MERRVLANGTEVAATFGIDVPTWSHYAVSPNMRYILWATQVASLWRHSFTARFLVLDTATPCLFNLSEGLSHPGVAYMQTHPI